MSQNHSVPYRLYDKKFKLKHPSTDIEIRVESNYHSSELGHTRLLSPTLLFY